MKLCLANRIQLSRRKICMVFRDDRLTPTCGIQYWHGDDNNDTMMVLLLLLLLMIECILLGVSPPYIMLYHKNYRNKY